ncbi:MAG TPA: hypothetical protein VN649_18120 [Ramlibacter sp.]|nr:hypothetical protein [Ramlibacter sp.]
MPSVVVNDERPLTFAEIQGLTLTEFPQDFGAYEDGCLALSPQDWEVLAKYFAFYGLRLPPNADADTTYALWRELRLDCGQAVRLASVGRSEEVQQLCPRLSPAKRAYAVAVGRQDTALAQRLARGLFTGPHRSLFCVPG